MGRFQNPWMECFFERVRKDKINLVRRQSGGGTVFIDEGNINFSFIGKIDNEKNFNFIISLLNSFNIKAQTNQRNDIILDGNKISGSAFKNTKDSKMHHLSLLVETDPSLLDKYLYKENSKFESKSIASKRSVVTTLNQKGLSIKKLFEKIQNLALPTLAPEIDTEFLEQMKSEKWIIEETPKFSAPFMYQGKEVFINSHKGKLISDNQEVLKKFYNQRLIDIEDLRVI